MDEKAIDRMYEAIMDVVDGQDYDSVMVVLGALHNSFALQHTLNSEKLRSLYDMMGDAAVCMAMIEDECNHQLQTKKNTPQKAKRKKARKKTGDEPGPFGSH